ncbi:aldehyde dehydrogenase family protein [Nocardia sp. CDC159]|uniref:Aldehyde dehydrogenase family protein n=1 Tax=Nocardia pulmonis TaxID=2951408 RepID=A0A9X2EDV3_9NOCA|nr:MULTISPECIES: aldehyde dehydrogenase family protein [Nocardia]MCM6776428.1 aldehyde dehydrogenase family protein [Nocardia pulmonis]MCM6788852.1 aldehyde dehydrogenase family protein [Nocardia sp. CDC159]
MLSARSNPASTAWITVTAPADGRLLGTVPTDTAAAVYTLVDRLRADQWQWRSLGVVGRVHWMTRFRDWLLDNRDSLVELLADETGKSVSAAVREFRLGMDALDYYRTHGAVFLDMQRSRPQGVPNVALPLAVGYRPCAVVGVLAGWTYPLAAMLFDAVPALLSGSAVLLRPASATPLTARAIVTGWADVGAPPVLEFAVGPEAGPAMVDTVDAVHFTGSPETGKVVALRAAARLIPCRLELGGKSSAIVLADADLDHAAVGIALGGLAESGQNCHSIERVFVESPVYDAFVDRLVTEVTAFAAADPDDPGVDVLTSAAHVRHLREQVRDAVAHGATLCVGGDGAGHVFAPTVLAEVRPPMRVLTQQTLGPVLPVVRVDDAAAAVTAANEGCGPCASVWTADEAAAAYVAGRLLAARVGHNDVSVHLAAPSYT